MNIHLPAILGFTRYQGFDPSPHIDTIWDTWPLQDTMGLNLAINACRDQAHVVAQLLRLGWRLEDVWQKIKEHQAC